MMKLKQFVVGIALYANGHYALSRARDADVQPDSQKITLGAKSKTGMLMLGLASAICPSYGMSIPTENTALQECSYNWENKYAINQVISNIETGTDHERQKIDIFTTTAAQEGDGKVPVMLFVHGGGWRQGGKNAPDWLRNWLIPLGFHVVAVGYRLGQHEHFPAQIEDVEAAVTWLKENADRPNLNIDTDRILAMGSSAGGHLVALLGTRNNSDDEARVRAVVNFYGPSLLTDNSPQIQNLLGCDDMDIPGTDCHELALSASPVHFANATDPPPILHMHGGADNVVPWRASEMLHNELSQNNAADTTFLLVQGASHNVNEVRTGESFVVCDGAMTAGPASCDGDRRNATTAGDWMAEWILNEACPPPAQ